MDIKDAARVLYNQGFDQKEIAKTLNRSENTISSWSKKGNWKEKKISEELMQDNSLQRILKLIDYQTKALERKVDKWMEEDQDEIKLIERGDIDALQKLFTTIRKDDKKFADYVHVMREFLSWLQIDHLDLAKQLTEIGDEFINEKRKLL